MRRPARQYMDSYVMTRPELTERDFERLSRLISGTCGIRMPAAKKTMLQARLHKRIRQLKITSLEDYCNYLFSDEGMKRELHCMIDVVTTNKTDFFREPVHFEFLKKTAVPSLVKRGRGTTRTLKCWSAGCSTGEEPYTLAIELTELAAKYDGLRFSILATDISVRALHAARLAIYRGDKAREIPFETKKKYFTKSRDSGDSLVRIAPGLRQLVKFQRVNLAEDYALEHRMDVVFCRNVLIYFDRPNQERVLARLCEFLNKDAFLFVGHSETLNGMKLPLEQAAPAVYVKK